MNIVNFKLEGMRSVSVLMHYSDICLEFLKKTTKFISKDSRFAVRDLNPGSAGDEVRMLSTPW